MRTISNKLLYKTVSGEAREYLTEKKSKFISTAAHCETEEEALEFLARIRKEFPDATHNVYAYIIDENNIFRYSDDGEPAQTAGMPVLDAMRKEGIVDAAVVVTRYFGGTLLGTGGLVHAYSASAVMGLKAAGIVTRMLCNIVSVKVDYNIAGKLQHMAATEHLPIEDIVYADDVTFYISVTPGETEKFLDKMNDISNGRAICTIIDTKYIDAK